MNGFLGVANGIEQVLTLAIEEIVTLLRFVVLFQCLWIHGTHGLDFGPDFLVEALGFGDTVVIQRGLGQLIDGDIQFLAAGFIQEFELGLKLDQLHFDVRPMLAGFVHLHADRLEALLAGGQRCAHASGFFGAMIHLRFDR